MLIAFDPSKVRFQNVKIKRVTTALGGSISILDEEQFAKTGKEKFHKIEIPMSLARMFQVKHKVSQFMVPHESVLMWYDNIVISLEKAVENAREQVSFDGVTRKWISNLEHHYKTLFDDEFANPTKDWYFDGLYAYNFQNNNLAEVVAHARRLDETGAFRAVDVQAVHLTHLHFKPAEYTKRSCVAFVIDKDTFSVSAPIWKQFDEKVRLTKTEDDEDGGKESLISSFKGIDSQIAINVNFALRAAKELAEQFGYESIQPLQLPKMMVQLKTVNLPRLPKEVKATVDIGLKFTHGLAWLLGLQYSATTPEQILTIRALIKYLMTKGYYWKAKTKKACILHDKTNSNVPLFSVEDLLKKVDENRFLPKSVDFAAEV